MSLDALPILLNPVRAVDLATILELTPGRSRPTVAMAYAELDYKAWGDEAGFDERTISRWLRRETKMPYGGAMRLAKVLGVDAECLFKDWADDKFRSKE